MAPRLASGPQRRREEFRQSVSQMGGQVGLAAWQPAELRERWRRRRTPAAGDVGAVQQDVPYLLRVEASNVVFILRRIRASYACDGSLFLVDEACARFWIHSYSIQSAPFSSRLRIRLLLSALSHRCQQNRTHQKDGEAETSNRSRAGKH